MDKQATFFIKHGLGVPDTQGGNILMRKKILFKIILHNLIVCGFVSGFACIFASVFLLVSQFPHCNNMLLFVNFTISKKKVKTY